MNELQRLGPTLLATLAIAVAAHAQDAPPEPTEAQAEPERGLLRRTDDAFEGYTLIAPLRSTSTFLLDMQGEVVHEWRNAYAPGNSVYLLENGNLLRCAREQSNPVFHGGGQGGRIQELRWDGAVLWDYVLSDETRMHHHDIEPLPNGNVLAIVWERRTAEEALAAGRDPEHVSERGFWPDALLEIEPLREPGGPGSGRIVWEWHAWDHMIQDRDPSKPNYASPAERPERVDINADHRYSGEPSAEDDAAERERLEQMRQLGYVGDEEDEEEDDADDDDKGDDRGRGSDWLHTNSVSYHPQHDLIAISVRELSEVWILDHSTTTAEAAGSTGGRHGKGGDLLARFGNPQNHGAGDAGDRRLFVQHDARWIPGGEPGALHLTVFNNGRGRPAGDHSSVDEFALPFAPERGFGRAPVEPVSSYVAPEPESFYSSFISGAERLPNGNTLICSGAQGRVFEVDAGGQTVWEFLNPHGGDVPPMSPGGVGGPRARDGERDEGRGPRARPDDARPGDVRPGRAGAGDDRRPPPRAERGERRPPAEGAQGRGRPQPPGEGGQRERPRRGGFPFPPPLPGMPGMPGPGGGGPGGLSRTGLFRATRIAPDHPGLALLPKQGG